MTTVSVPLGGHAGRVALSAALAFGAGVLALILLVSVVGGQQPVTAPGGEGVNTADIPAAYVSWVLAAGSVCATITPAVIAAQDQVESDWDPCAVSMAGAEGIVQFLPSN